MTDSSDEGMDEDGLSLDKVRWPDRIDRSALRAAHGQSRPVRVLTTRTLECVPPPLPPGAMCIIELSLNGSDYEYDSVYFSIYYE